MSTARITKWKAINKLVVKRKQVENTKGKQLNQPTIARSTINSQFGTAQFDVPSLIVSCIIGFANLVDKTKGKLAETPDG